jgi:hypothetical protein
LRLPKRCGLNWADAPERIAPPAGAARGPEDTAGAGGWPEPVRPLPISAGGHALREICPAVRLLAFAPGIITGTLAALAGQICLAHLNIDLATITGQAAFACWTMTLVPLVIGYIAATMAQFMMPHGWPLQLLRWIVGTAIVAALAVIGHDAGAMGSPDAGTQVGASLLGAIFAMSTASIGAYIRN